MAWWKYDVASVTMMIRKIGGEITPVVPLPSESL